jgi:hypothetical protein
MLVIASLVVAFLIGEGLLRVAGYRPGTLVASPQFSENTWAKPDERLGWTNKAGTFHSIEAGHAMMGFWPDGRRVSWSEQSKPASRNVYVIGGSFTQGYGFVD